MENFKTQWHNEAEPEKEESNRELPIPQLGQKNRKVRRPFFSKLGLELKQTVRKGSGTSTPNHAD